MATSPEEARKKMLEQLLANHGQKLGGVAQAHCRQQADQAR
jgi:hypothetical protein